ncbi:four helix bundle protein [bacterium]|nr:four helix bundle protein [candidate division CSSED10-310 bacterium]
MIHTETPPCRSGNVLQQYRDLRLWQRALELSRTALLIFRDSVTGDPELIRTIRALAIQIPALIATGQSRGSTADSIRLLASARGELAALDTCCMLANQLGMVDLTTRRQIEVLIIETASLIDQAFEKNPVPL